MVFSNIVPSQLGTLSLQQALELTNVYLENAYKMKDVKVALALCHDAEVALSQAKKANRKYPAHPDDTWYQALHQGVATAYVDLGKYLDGRGYGNEAAAIYKKAEKWGGNANDTGRFALLSRPTSIVQPSDIASPPADGSSPHASRATNINQRPKFATVSVHIFAENLRPPAIEYKLPQPDERLINTPQLVCCLSLLQDSSSSDDALEPVTQKWIQTIEKDADEQERLHALSKGVIRAFMRDELKDAKAIAEVVCLATVLNKDTFHDLLRELYSGIDHSGLLSFHHLEGLAQLIQGAADPGHLSADDLVKILELLSSRLQDTHQQSAHHMHQLTLAVSHVLDAMADTKVTGIDRKNLHEPLSTYLSGLMNSHDPFLVYQAAYAYQALLCVPDNETTWQAAMRRTGKIVKGVAGLVSAVKGLDLERFLDGLTEIQQGIEGVFKVVEVVRNAYDDVTALVKGGQGFVECLKEGLSFERRRDWYAALRGADILIRAGELATFKELVSRASCRYDPAFQWGVCQRLGEMAANPSWDAVTRRSAIAFLGEIYQDDEMWGHQASNKQWILNIVMQLASTKSSGASGGDMQLHTIVAGALLQDLETCDNTKKLELYRVCRANGPTPYPLKITLPELGSPSLLDRVQNRPDVEGNIRVLRKQRTKERGTSVYIPPQAKPTNQAPDDTRFPLMEKVKEFLDSEQKVFLLLGDSGAGKSTFTRALECELWQTYENKTGRIPLHINLPTIEKPEHDMIAKQLRKSEFTEPQIREMKHHRKFILICDGYDESQQTHNLYMTNKLNQSGEWDAQMVISCRSEYLGADYRHRFQPVEDRNTRLDSLLFQEAVVAPFTMDQVQAYIRQYVALHQPLWRVEDYTTALERIPSLNDLVKNPFLMTLSLDVLPRMVDPGQDLSAAHVTRVALYDHFVEQWLERGKKRLGEKDMSRQTKAAFEKLSAEGFTLSGIEYLKKLAVAIYKEQGGNPVVEYSQLVDEQSWKRMFFEKEHKQLLLEACPLTRNGNQHRFIHRSLLEYGLARAVFDPQDRRNRGSLESVLGRRGSTSSTLSFEMEDVSIKEATTMTLEPDPSSPLVWRSFVNDHSLLQFLEERVEQEPVFKQQLLSYIEYSKRDKKWRKAAANAITILVRSGTQFKNADLRGIQIPGADLSYGVFDCSSFQEADLRKANLQGIWMRQSDLSGAQMDGVQFGELPYLSEDFQVYSCAYSPDGTSFAVGLENGNISLYSTSNWEKVMTLSGHQSSLTCIGYSPDGNQVASTSYDCTVRLWEVKTGACQQMFINSNAVYCTAYSPEGGKIAIGGQDKMLRLRDVITGECIMTLSGHTSTVRCTAFSPQGDTIATGSFDTTVRLWDVETGNLYYVMRGHENYVWDVAYSPRGDQIASASWDCTVRLWDVKTGLCHHVLKHNNLAESVVYSPKDDRVASGCSDNTVRIWDVKTGVLRHTLTGHDSHAVCVVYSPHGNHIASGSSDKTVRLWDVSSGASRLVQSDRHAGTLDMLTCSPNGDQFVSFRSGNMIRLLDVDTGVCRRVLRGHGADVYSAQYSPQGDMIVSCDGHRSVLLWSLESGISRHLHTIDDTLYTYPCFAFSADGHTIAYVCGTATMHLLDVATGECKAILIGQSGRVTSVVFSPDGKLIASGSWGGTVWIRDVGTFARRHTLNCSAGVQKIMFSPQGHQLASTSDDTAVRLWDVATGECLMILFGHVRGIISIMYSLNGDTLVTGCNTDDLIRFWDVGSGQCRAAIRGNRSTFQYVRGIIRGINSEDMYVGTWSIQGAILWKIVDEKDRCSLVLRLVRASGALEVAGLSMQGVRGLSQLNKQLLRQRGAEGDPVSKLQEAGKKVIAIASVLSKLKQPTESDSTTPIIPSDIDSRAEKADLQDE